MGEVLHRRGLDHQGQQHLLVKRLVALKVGDQRTHGLSFGGRPVQPRDEFGPAQADLEEAAQVLLPPVDVRESVLQGHERGRADPLHPTIVA